MLILNPTDLKVTIQTDEMTVSDLIELLSKYPPDLRLVYPNQEGGFHPIHGLRPEILALNVNDEWWYGKHDYPEAVNRDELASKQQELCLMLTK